MAEFLVGQTVRVATSCSIYGACFKEGTEGVVISVNRPGQEPFVEIDGQGYGFTQEFHPDEIELIQTAIPVAIPKEEKKVTTTETAIPKTDIKTIYTVVQDGETIGVYIDREVAREVKAEMGGRAAGAEILQFKPAKTIR